MGVATEVVIREQRCLWIESEGEAAQIGRFIDLSQFVVAVGKSGSKRDVGDEYLSGNFRLYDVEAREATNEVISSGPEIRKIVQFGIPDILVSIGKTPLAAIELTSHKPTYNNIFQRFPKLNWPSVCGVPSYIFQLHEAERMKAQKSSLLAAADRASKQNGSPCLVYLYEDHEIETVQAALRELIDSITLGNDVNVQRFEREAVDRSARALVDFDLATFGGRFFESADEYVLAHVRVTRNCDSIDGIECGVNHCETPRARRQTAEQIRSGTHLTHLTGGALVKCVWITKGTGGLDPYPGYILAGKLLLCTSSDGVQNKQMVVRFENVPREFWWWQSAETRLNNRMINIIADRVLYQGESL